MSGRRLAILALAALIAVAAAWYVRRPPAPSSPGPAPQSLLPGLADRLPQVEAVRVRVGGGRILARVERDGDAWRVANRHGYPADRSTLRGTLIALAEARRAAPRAEDPQDWPRLGLRPIEQADAAGVELTLEGLDPAPRILIGKPAAGDAPGTYVRRVGQGERAWRVSQAIDRPDAIADWLDPRVVDLPTRRLRAVRLDPRDGEPVEIERVGADSSALRIANRPEGRRLLSPSIARSIARIVTGLELTDVRPAASTEGPPPLANARFTTFGGLQVTITALAAERGAPPRYVRVEASAAEGAAEALHKEAARINERVGDWLYEIPDYKFVNLTQTLEGVLEPRRADE